MEGAGDFWHPAWCRYALALLPPPPLRGRDGEGGAVLICCLHETLARRDCRLQRSPAARHSAPGGFQRPAPAAAPLDPFLFAPHARPLPDTHRPLRLRSIILSL